MAGDEQCRSWRLRAGAYLGEISALSFIPLPPQLSSFPLLLAGTGSQILVYNVKSGDLLDSFDVFQGIRVHGIALRSPDPEDSSSPLICDFSIAVFGERRVKLFRVRIGAEPGLNVGLKLVCRLPGFDHWVLDVCFLKEDDVLAVGLSDNSVVLWDVNRSNMVLRVKSSERCLLYSMRMRGDSIEALRMASGTIYNEILIWKISPESLLSSSALLKSSSPCNHNDIRLHCQQYVDIHLTRLIGHEGSIFRIAWSSDGTKVMSVSDDRSARIWMTSGQRQDPGDSGEICGHNVSANITLFGHNARIWDCYISDSIVITAGEDCTCRVWGMDGNQLLAIKEHIGRGIWRCLYDPSSSLLISAGFDSAIKVHQLCPSLRETTEQNGMLNKLKDQKEIFTIHAPKVSQQFGLMDSKSEYIRCLRFTRENVLYVATNNGYLHRVELSNPGDVKWTELARVSKEAPIVCMDLIIIKSSDFSLDVEDIIALGDGKGNVTVVKLNNADPTPKLASSFTWPAEKERQLLGIHWCKSLGCSNLFTADPRGVLKLWKIRDTSLSDAANANMDPNVSLIAVFTSCFGARIMCLDASIKEEILICGDQRGNINVFPLSEGLMTASSSKTVEKIHVLNHFKGAHGISSVTSILIATLNFDHVEIRTTGGDGCICYFKYDKNLQSLEFIGMKQLKELSTIQSVFTNSTTEENLAQPHYAVGFTSTDFIVWNLVNEIKMLQIPCGGWRRSYSYHVGAVPEYQNCFAFLKDHDIHIHRHWVPAHERQLLPQVLHMQYHGREIHSLCFVSFKLHSNPNKSCSLWTATGCEDGTVRLTRYMPFDMGNWCESKLLGEHVGGSAVRSVCFISKIYTTRASQTYSSDSRYINQASSESRDNQFLLISVGAKQVLTSWLLRYRASDIQAHFKGTLTESEHISSPSTSEFSSISFQWFSSHMPPKFASTYRRVENLLELSEKRNASTVKSDPLSESCLVECKDQKPKSFIMDQNENDWRYLAVTAFLVRHADSRLTVCFIVVACSDATLTLRALILPHRLWFDVALLVPQTSPVLTLQHIVVPGVAHSNDSVQFGNAYIIISGSTDGSITFWDLTGTVEYFMQLVLEIQPQMLIDCQKRPQTGRGSQGGRWWRSSTNQTSDNSVGDALSKIKGGNNIKCQSADTIASEASSMEGSDPLIRPTSSLQTTSFADFHMPGKHSDKKPSEKREVRPLYVLNSVHQSGVNCLHVSKLKDCLHSEPETVYCVLSGGDDQALHCLCFDLGVPATNPDASHRQPTDTEDHVQNGIPSQLSGSSFIRKCTHRNLTTKLTVLYRDMIPSAHNSAVKGIWTDGCWTFSTGLDQRIRCWKLGRCGTLTEHAQLVISVPEPEALDAVFCGSAKNSYQIAVAGRGMQMVEFCASSDD